MFEEKGKGVADQQPQRLRFPTRPPSIAKLSARTAILDREIGVFDEQLCSRLDHLNHPDPSIVSTSPLLMAFDLIASTVWN